ncbi:aminotransferase class I/II-fold pyridoxal phosphate-dependent enzyme [Salinibacillus xinjiangensis]|uniref:Aminotransferase class I/II-fold pyridoxal phosphate-dependent enzyme n=1 Tax=Salinibacillus xinjiangensis TaxID=1229268 RepID=A0A6G1XB44_9BACI|nr:aminotransferase class I/II-fold pyridoxal phosphate-dependent enzyme [Salinibacillus xinjiangensis]MRG88152.1 aminotransferase class I/II-fold pyridoxal phosphate-dependent enzyme [Salinibacillus xinjiangensis]
MVHNQKNLPIFEALNKHVKNNPESFHVPGHKNGSVFPEVGLGAFQDILRYDLTEITGMDDLHHPESAIQKAQELTSQLYKVEESYFLVGGSTVGNLAMIFSVCGSGDQVIVQRNCHKSIMNALELVGAQPIFVAPIFERKTNRYSKIDVNQIKEALEQYPESKAVVLTYPDYFGHTYPLKKMIELAHGRNIPVLVDEAHGAHFILGEPFPPSATSLGADVVVQSAHKMLPAMTMASFLHVNSSRISNQKVASYLRMLQSSSPSYPLMASLDIARYFLAHYHEDQLRETLMSVQKLRSQLDQVTRWDILPEQAEDDPLKITIQVRNYRDIDQFVRIMERSYIFPELSTTNQILLIHGLKPHYHDQNIHKLIMALNNELKSPAGHDKIESAVIDFSSITKLPFSYEKLNNMRKVWVPWEEAIGEYAAEVVTPYPPGIPFIVKGEQILKHHVHEIKCLVGQNRHIHYEGKDLEKGIEILK